MVQASPHQQSAALDSLKTGADTYSSAIADAQNYMNWVIDQFQPYLRGQIVEVGFGHGHYSGLLSEFGDYLDRKSTRLNSSHSS